MLGLFAFFYGTLHFTTYIWLDQFFDVPSIVKDVMKRPFITAGFSAFLGMLPLALTSTTGWIRRLGGRNWQRLHRLIYVSALGGVLHYWWLVKADVQRPQIYATLIGVLLLYRLVVAYLRRTPRPVPSTSGAWQKYAYRRWGGIRGATHSAMLPKGCAYDHPSCAVPS